MGQGQRNDLKPPPWCGCGCRRRVKRRRQKYLAGHVPASVFAVGGKKGGATRRFTARRRIFAEEFARLTQDGRTVNKDAILDAFNAVSVRFYHLGYSACEAKWMLRTRKQEAA
jgi:hypothetical protein